MKVTKHQFIQVELFKKETQKLNLGLGDSDDIKVKLVNWPIQIFYRGTDFYPV